MCDCRSEVSNMNAKEKIEELLEASEDGTITAAQVTEAGLHRSVLQEFALSRLPTMYSLRLSTSLTFGKLTITPASGLR